MTGLNNTREKLSGQMGAQLPLATEPSARVKELSATPGKRVEAIRALRAETALGVREAVQIVDALRAQARKRPCVTRVFGGCAAHPAPRPALRAARCLCAWDF